MDRNSSRLLQEDEEDIFFQGSGNDQFFQGSSGSEDRFFQGSQSDDEFFQGSSDKRSGFSLEELSGLLREQGMEPPEEEEKAGFLTRLISGVTAFETSEAAMRAKENGSMFFSEYVGTIGEKLDTTFTGDLPEEAHRTFEDFLHTQGFVDNPGKLDVADAAGFVGDVLLDPTTYLTLGTGAGIKVGSKAGLKAATSAGTRRLTKKASRDLADKTKTNIRKGMDNQAARETAEKEVIEQFGEKGFQKKAVRFMGQPIAPMRQGDPLAKIGASKIPALTKTYDAIGKAFKWDYKPIGESSDTWAKRIAETENFRNATRSAKPLTNIEIQDWTKNLDGATAKQVTDAIEELSVEVGEEAATNIVKKAARHLDKSELSRLSERTMQLNSPKLTEFLETQKKIQYAPRDEARQLQKRLSQLTGDSQLHRELDKIRSGTEESEELGGILKQTESAIDNFDNAQLSSLLTKLENKGKFSELPAEGQRAAKEATKMAFERRRALARAGVQIGDISTDDMMVGGYISHIPTKEFLKMKKGRPEISKFVTGNASKAKTRTLKGSASSINDDFKKAVATSNYLRRQNKNVRDEIVKKEFDDLMTAMTKGVSSQDRKLEDAIAQIQKEAEELPDMFETDIRQIAQSMGVDTKKAIAKKELFQGLQRLGEPAPEVLRPNMKALDFNNISFLGKDNAQKLTDNGVDFDTLTNANPEDIANILGSDVSRAKSVITKAKKIMNESAEVTHIVDDGYAQIKSLPELSHLQFPEQTARAIDDFGEEFFSSKPVGDILKAHDKIQNFYKGNLTSLFPAFHGRNMVSNTVNQLMGTAQLALHPLRQKTGLDLAIGRNLDKTITTKTGETMTLKELREEGIRLGVTGSDFFKGEVGTSQEFTKLMGKWNPVTRAQRFGTSIEDQAKMTMFAEEVIQGQNMNVAASKVKEFLFDYGQLSSLEKNVMRRGLPFYTWSRKNFTLQARKIFEEPGKYATTFKAIRSIGGGENIDQETYESLPDWMQDSLIVKTNKKDEYGAPKYMAGLGIPIEEFTETADQIRSALGIASGNSTEDTRDKAMQLLGRTAFLPKALLERATNRDFFRGRELTEVDNANDAVAVMDNWFTDKLINDEEKQAMMNWMEIREEQVGVFRGGEKVGTKTKYTGDPDKLHMIRSLPTSRFQATLGRFSEFEEESKGFGAEDILAFTTGMRNYAVDAETQKHFRERDMETEVVEQLERLGVIEQFSRAYIPEDNITPRRPEDFLDDEDMDIINSDDTIGSELFPEE